MTVDAAQDAATIEVAAPRKDISNFKELMELTTCGLTAQQAKGVVTSLSVPNQGPQLAYWPPAVCQFTGLSSINLSGNAITFIPQAVQNLPNLQQLLMARNDLGSLPPEIGALTALTELDVGGNKLRVLPNTLCSLTGLKVLNAWGNELTRLPDGFGGLTSLVRLGLKGNQLSDLPDSFCQLHSLVELFLTDNKLTTLPAGFGGLKSLVKLQASYNPFESLPDGLWGLPALELFRMAVGELQEWSAGLGALPRLAWCSIGSNPAAAGVPPLADLPAVTVADVALGTKLGQGASGEVFEGVYGGEPVAIKLFLPGASPDGSTRDEIAITCSNHHPNLTEVLAVVVDEGVSCEGVEDIKGLVMRLVKGQPMADRPTSQHLLRCKWPAEVTYSSSQAVSICQGVASALEYLHSKGVCHGDVYAHNIMLEGSCHPVLCDFGAAFCYDRPAAAGGFWEAMQMRAFGLFMEGLMQQTVEDSTNSSSSGGKQQLQALMDLCLSEQPAARPTFAALTQRLGGMQ